MLYCSKLVLAMTSAKLGKPDKRGSVWISIFEKQDTFRMSSTRIKWSYANKANHYSITKFIVSQLMTIDSKTWALADIKEHNQKISSASTIGLFTFPMLLPIQPMISNPYFLHRCIQSQFPCYSLHRLLLCCY